MKSTISKIALSVCAVLVLTLALTLALLLVPQQGSQPTATAATVVAWVTIGNSTVSYLDFPTAWSNFINATGGDPTLTLYTDIETSKTLEFPFDKTGAIDLNNRNLSLKAGAKGSVIRVGGNLTITDESTQTTHTIGGHTITGGSITGGNGNTTNGGGIYVDNGATLTLDKVTIACNQAKLGGGVYVEANAMLNITGGTIAYNQSTTGGGGIFCNYNSSTTINNVTISDNTTNSGGGGIYSSGALSLNNVTMSRNTSSSGGGIYAAGSGSVTISGTTGITGNSITGGGAGLYVEKNTTVFISGPIQITGDADGKDIYFSSNDSPIINITGSLQSGSKTAKVRLPQLVLKFTSGYSTHNPDLDPNTVFECMVDGYHYTLQDGEVLAKRHAFDQQTTNHPAQAATCTTPAGYYKTCICGEVGTATFTSGAALGHIGGTATCQQAAKCTRCGVSYGNPLPHTSGNWIVDTAATCTTDGAQHKECTVCGTELNSEPITALGHAYGDLAWAWADDGNSATVAFTCSQCNDTQTISATITSAVKTEATCTAMGTTTYTATATFADTEYTDSKDIADIAMLEHVYDQQVTADAHMAHAATCTAPASYYYSCACGANGTTTFTSGTALGHTGGTASFQQSAVCDRCGETYGNLAAVDDGGTVTGYDDLDIAWNALINATGSNPILLLKADVSTSQTLTVPVGKVVTVDLNGHILSLADGALGSVIKVYGNLTIRDNAPTTSHVIGGQTIKGGVITGGKIIEDETTFGGGINVQSGALYMQGGTVAFNQAQWGGGIFVNAHAHLTLSKGAVQYNTATIAGGGIAVYGQNDSFAQATLQADSLVADNTTTTGGNGGGGIYVCNADVVVGGTVQSNVSATYGGGIYLYSGTLSLLDATLCGNTSNGQGGGVNAQGGSINIDGTTQITGNSGNSVAGLFAKGGVPVSISGPIKITDNIGSYNTNCLYNGSMFVVVGKLCSADGLDHARLGLLVASLQITSGYSTYNADLDPNDVFTIEGNNNYCFTLQNNEVTAVTHSYGTATSISDTQHQVACSRCGKTAVASHVYDQQVTTDAHMAHAATCTVPASYYYSCVCGANDTTTFTHGSTIDHNYQYTDTGSGTHQGVCQGCGDTTEQNHTFDPDTRLCTMCGVGQPIYWCILDTALVISPIYVDGGTAEGNFPFDQAAFDRFKAPWDSHYATISTIYTTADHVDGYSWTEKTMPTTMYMWFMGLNYLTHIDLSGMDCSMVGDNVDLTSNSKLGTVVAPAVMGAGKIVLPFATCCWTSADGVALTANLLTTQHAGQTFTRYIQHVGGTATCQQAAVCERCGVSYGELAAHTLSDWIVDTAATCTAEGAQHKECTVCHTELETDTIAMLAHTPSDWIIDTEATCTTAGAQHKECTVCGTELETGTIAMLAHTPSDWIVDTAATCTTDGTQHKNCTVCGAELNSETIPALGHDLQHHNAQAATCTAIGWNEYDTCSRCDYSTYAPINNLPHTPGDWIVDTEATCTTDGTKHKECTVCGTVVENGTIDMVAHTFSDWIVDTAATCTAAGAQHKECTVCHTELETDTIAMLAHTSSDWIVDTAATCTTDGAQHKECTVCHTVLNSEPITALGHAYGDPTWTWADNGSSATVAFTCSRCNDTQTIAATITSAVKSAASCTVMGTTTYTATATFADTEYTDSKDIDDIAMLVHTPSDWIVDTEVTCTAEGAQHKECTVCGTVVENGTIDMVAHTPSDWIVDTTATCTAEGAQHKECIVCDTVLNSETIPATGHAYGNPTWTWADNGSTATVAFTCSQCNDTQTITATISSAVKTEATCTAMGTTTYSATAIFADTEYTDSKDIADIDMLAHTTGDWVIDTAATCTSEGAQHKECTVCHTVLENGTIDMVAHTSSDWIVDTAATCAAEGAQHKECTVCHAELETDTIAISAHTMTDWIDEIPATTTEVGTKGHKDCLVCGKHFDSEDNELTDLVIPVLAPQYTVSVEGGSIQGTDQTSIEVSSGGEVTVIAADVSGQVFMGWSIDDGKTILNKQQSYTFAATQNVNLVAVYQPADVQSAMDSTGDANTWIMVGCLLGLFVALYVVGAVLYLNNQIDGKICDILYFYLKARKKN